MGRATVTCTDVGEWKVTVGLVTFISKESPRVQWSRPGCSRLFWPALKVSNHNASAKLTKNSKTSVIVLNCQTLTPVSISERLQLLAYVSCRALTICNPTYLRSRVRDQYVEASNAAGSKCLFHPQSPLSGASSMHRHCPDMWEHWG